MSGAYCGTADGQCDGVGQTQTGAADHSPTPPRHGRTSHGVLNRNPTLSSLTDRGPRTSSGHGVAGRYVGRRREEEQAKRSSGDAGAQTAPRAIGSRCGAPTCLRREIRAQIGISPYAGPEGRIQNCLVSADWTPGRRRGASSIPQRRIYIARHGSTPGPR